MNQSSVDDRITELFGLCVLPDSSCGTDTASCGLTWAH